jgi:hypothetical protein
MKGSPFLCFGFTVCSTLFSLSIGVWHPENLYYQRLFLARRKEGSNRAQQCHRLVVFMRYGIVFIKHTAARPETSACVQARANTLLLLFFFIYHYHRLD